MGYKLGYHILVLPNQVLLVNSVLANEVLLYVCLNATVCDFAFISNPRSADIKKGDSPKVLFTADLPAKSANPVLKISPDGHVIAIGLSSTIYIYSGTDGEVLEVLDAVHHGEMIHMLSPAECVQSHQAL